MAGEVKHYNDGPLADAGFPFSESVRVGDLLILSGQIGTGDDSALAAGGIGPESHQMMKNISDALSRRGLGFGNIVKCTVFLADIAEWPAFNDIYKEYFNAPYPARSALGANGLALNARVEMECIAAYP